ncbi:MAG: hypothetical protein AB7G10_02290 [Reyranellaceae bacterium]
MTVMVKPTEDLNAIAARVPKIISRARILLRRTSAALSVTISKETIALANRYFLTGAFQIGTQDLKTIKANLELITNGIASNMTIKIGDLPGSGDDDVHGEVSSQGNLNLVKPYHNVAFRHASGANMKYGAIKIATGTLNQDRLGVETFIHEASHKYAGTKDYCYFNDDSITPDGVFDDKNEALVNADSYGWFVYNVGSNWRC